ncbi:hypothetical protein EXIGLDRAFT_727793 [Exidia glandulosa HHB12029]|uniref:Uncharacterized protein n=1 Tax=Exidia glandulosa HHB12029 TaxID=1314781 RepID=A0A165ZM06_EXIGL|nr:hypothetical protein EXIGLDRAFT_727793 [Exidia glandulosa HHB12029]
MIIVFLRVPPVPSTRTGSDSSPESTSRGASAAPFCSADSEPDAVSPGFALFAGTSSSGPSARRFACADGVAGPDPFGGGAALPARDGTALPARDGGAL